MDQKLGEITSKRKYNQNLTIKKKGRTVAVELDEIMTKNKAEEGNDKGRDKCEKEWKQHQMMGKKKKTKNRLGWNRNRNAGSSE